MKYCPQCGKPSLENERNHRFFCKKCDFVMFLNVAAAVAAVIRCGDELFLTVRANNPAKGKLDFAGGFADPGESLEDALIRELQEELNFTVKQPHYLVSFSNTYPYRGLTYKTADAFFLVDVDKKPAFTLSDELTGMRWIKTAELNPEDLAFDSGREILALLRQQP